MIANKLVVTVPVTGGGGDRSQSPYLPITPKQIADSALGACKAGASVAHIHVRDTETGKPSMNYHLYEEVFHRIRDHSDMIISLSCGAGGRFVPDGQEPIGFGEGTMLAAPEKRIEHVVRLKPEICSLDVGSMMFGQHVFVNYLPFIEIMAEQVRDAGVKPELEVFDLGHIEIAKHLINSGKVKNLPIIQLCMGIKWGAPATAQNIVFMKQALPEDAIWGGFSIGSKAFDILAQIALIGGNVRIGMEDNIYMEKGRLATSNKEMVERGVRIMRTLGKEPATINEAKSILQLYD
jgi:uncharacterized protein (DUF849 family)